MYNEALWWLNKGISVVPQVYGTKIPSVKWKNYTLRKPPTKLVESWFQGKRNLGVIPTDGLFVFDFDIPYEYVKWAQAHKGLSQTMTVKTKRGWHVYLYLENGDEARDCIWPFGDIKTDMTVTVPPSKVGNWNYRYTKGRSIEKVSCLKEAGIEVAARVDFEERPTGGESEYAGVEGCIVDYLSRLTKLNKRSDGTLIGQCPFHEDKKPSLQVWPVEGRFYCHSTKCQAHRRCDINDALEMRTI